MDSDIELEGIIIDVDYITRDGRSIIRIALKTKDGVMVLIDESFYPYFYLNPFNKELAPETILKMQVPNQESIIKIGSVEWEALSLKGKETRMLKVSVGSTRDVPVLSEQLREFGERYEYDILFWKRYLIDHAISPLAGVHVKAHKNGDYLSIDSLKAASVSGIELKHLCFDIETYNPAINPRPEVDPVIMISYKAGERSGVLTTKKIKRDFITQYANEKELIEGFTKIIKEIDPDVISGYNSSNFDLPYLLSRSKKNKIKFGITRYEDEEPRTEHHGLIEAVKIPGRSNVDMYNVTRFISIVGASEKLLKINRFTLSEVYAAITGDTKIMVNKQQIWQIWDGTDLDREELADYSLSDSITLDRLYDFFIPLEIEIAKISGSTLAETAISTTGQIVEYVLMRYATANKEIVPNKPEDSEIMNREANPIEGAYVKTPEAGIYDNIAVFDFRGLYPSIIIANNIDPATMCDDCTEFYESPIHTKFRKKPEGIIPKALRLMTAERAEIKKAYKKDPDNKTLGARSQALKIIANSFYGYLGYARSRWYSRDCAGSVTAYGREAIAKTMDDAEKSGFKVLYGDSISGDSIIKIRSGESQNSANVKIKDLFNHVDELGVGGKEYQFVDNLYAETIDKDGKVVFGKIKYIMRHKTEKRMHRIRLTNSLHIDATEDHSIIGVANLSKIPGKGIMDRLVEVKPSEIGTNIRSVVVKKKTVRGIIESRNYSKELYELMGFFVGDGSFDYGRYKGKRTKRYYLAIAAGNEQEEITTKILTPLALTDRITSIYTKKKGDLVCTGLDTVRLFESELLNENRKCIPKFIFNEREENVNSFLRGLFSSDGTVMIRNKKPIIRYTTIDKELAEQIHELLWEVGIASSVFKENNVNKYNGKSSGTYSYHVCIKTKHKFIKDVGFITDKKNGLISNYTETSFQKRYVNDTDFDISQVMKVEEIENQDYVYDLEIDGIHRFFANGILVHNTDSIFILMQSKTKDDVGALLKKVNASLPGSMELELEDFYVRGVFVGKRGTEGGAKKKYALLSESGRIKIRGFELVRRDWSAISRETQRSVLEAILKEGSKSKAISIVKEVIQNLKSGKVEFRDLVIYTQLRKRIDKYDNTSPELAAVKKAIERKLKRKDELEGSTVGYIITKDGSSISEKAELAEYAKSYDPDYYINHQVIPATLKILKELGFSEEELKSGGSQKRLGL